jgi:mannose-6-phosphate isomerase
MEMLTFKPLYMERVWGGRGLEAKLGRRLPEGKVIGESWELVDREGEQSVVAEGPLSGKTIRELLESSAEAILGPGRDGSAPSPSWSNGWIVRTDSPCRSTPPPQLHPRSGASPRPRTGTSPSATPEPRSSSA